MVRPGIEAGTVGATPEGDPERPTEGRRDCEAGGATLEATLALAAGDGGTTEVGYPQQLVVGLILACK